MTLHSLHSLLLLVPPLFPSQVPSPVPGEPAPLRAVAPGDDSEAAEAGFLWVDCDADERTDAVVVCAGGSLRLLLNRGDGELIDATAGSGLEVVSDASLVSAQDVDVDGSMDLLVSTRSGASLLLRNDGGGRFRDESGRAGLDHVGPNLGVRWFDWDGDGRPDLQLRTPTDHLLYRNAGDGLFERLPLELPGDPIAAPGSVWIAPPPAGHAEHADEEDQRVRHERRAANATARLGATLDLALAGLDVDALRGTNPGGGSFGLAPLLAGLTCVATLRDTATGNCLTASSVGTLGALYPLSVDLNVTPAGSVGIGTTSPAEKLHIAGSTQVDGDVRSSGDVFGDRVLAGFGSTAEPSYRFTPSEPTGLASPAVNTLTVSTAGVEVMRVTSSRNVGIGDATPTGKLDVASSGSGVGGATIRATNTNGGSGIALVAATQGTDATVVVSQSGSGSLIRGFDGGCCPIFEVKNSGRVVGTALQITGGGDLVEGFDTGDEDCPPGTVVVIDTESPGRLAACTEPYDRRVAGIVSGAGGVDHGIRMGQEGVLDGGTLMAMAGRVYVRCNAENGVIEPGDLLTTSSVRGEAMRATDPGRSFGAVIGKALGERNAETGLVLVLVSLQ